MTSVAFIKTAGKMALALDELFGTGSLRDADPEIIRKRYNMGSVVKL